MNNLKDFHFGIALACIAVCMVAILLELRGIREDLKRIETQQTMTGKR